jgi:DNA-binding beta-propeller fold protein YncE
VQLSPWRRALDIPALQIVVVGILVACAADTQASPTVAASIAVSPDSFTLAQGASQQLVARVFDGSRRELSGVTVQYNSLDTARVRVSNSGVVQAVGTIGPAGIRVTADTATAMVHVLVTATPKRLTLDPDTSLLLPGGTEQLAAVLHDYTDAPIGGSVVTFRSSDSATVQVMPSGQVTSLGPSGTVVITAASDTFIATAVVVVAGHPTGSTVIHKSLAPTNGVAVSRSGRVLLTQIRSVVLGQLPDTLFSPQIGSGDPDSRIVSVAFSADGAIGYLPDLKAGQLAVLSVSSGSVTGYPFKVPGAFLMSVVVSSDGARLFVGCNNDTVYTLDAASGAVVHATDAFGWSAALALHPFQPLVYASTYNGGRVAEINATTGTLARLLTVGGTPQSVAVSPDGTELFVANEASGLQVWDLVADTLKDSVAVAGGGFGVALSPDGSQVWMTSAGPGALTGKVWVFDRATRATLNTINVGGNPRRIAFDFAGTTAVVADDAGAVVYIR